MNSSRLKRRPRARREFPLPLFRPSSAWKLNRLFRGFRGQPLDRTEILVICPDEKAPGSVPGDFLEKGFKVTPGEGI